MVVGGDRLGRYTLDLLQGQALRVRQLVRRRPSPSYLNFEDVIEAGTARATHGPNYDRLVAIKRRYDPDNRFRSRRSLVG
jgi:hypothetical protein